MNRPPFFLRLFSVFALPFALASALSAGVVINDSAWSSPTATSKVGDSSGLNYYGSSSSGQPAGSGSLSLTGDDLTLTSSGRGLLVNFSQQTLSSVGDSLSASFTFTFTGTPTESAAILRSGIFNNTGGALISANNYGNNVGANYTGYQVTSAINDPNGPTSTGIYRKIPGANILTSSSSVANYDSLGSKPVSSTPTLVAGISYTSTLTLTRTESGLNLAYALSGGTIGTVFDFSLEDTAPSYSFTTIELRGGTGTFDSVTLSNFNVTFTPVPEPSICALLLGGMAGTWVIMRRRRARFPSIG